MFDIGDIVVRHPAVSDEEFLHLSTPIDRHTYPWVFNERMVIRDDNPDEDGEIEVYPYGEDGEDYIFVRPSMVITPRDRDKIVEGMKNELLEMAEEIDEERR